MIFAAVDDPAAAAVACAFRGDSSRHAGVSGLRGVVIGAPIGAVIGAVIGYQVAK